MKTKLFSVTIDDFDMQVFRAGGNGGQKQNKTSTGVRLIHRPSGARGESRQHRTQGMNKREAWKRAIETPEFQRWLEIEGKRRSGRLALEEAAIEKAVNRALKPSNLKIEVFENGEWKDEQDAEG